MVMMRAVQVMAPNAGLELVECERPEPDRGEARVRVQACGICHSDAFTVRVPFRASPIRGCRATRSPA